MAGNTCNSINATVDSVIKLLTDNASTLGGLVGVYERDESPAIAFDNGVIPVAYVIPLVEGKDNFDIQPGGIPVARHSFPINIVAYYVYPTVEAGIRPTRGFGYTALDLFRETHSLPIGQVIGGGLEVGYFQVVDVVVHYFILTLNVKAMI